MEPIRLNIATFNYVDKKMVLIISAIAISFALLTAVNTNLYVANKNKISDYEKKTSSIQKNMSKNKSNADINSEEWDKIQLQVISANQIIVKDVVPWSRLFEILETKIPSGMFIESINPTNDYQTLIIEGKSTSERKITFFMKRLKEVEFLSNSILTEFSIGTDADGRFNKEGNNISFRIKNKLHIENLFDEGSYRQTIKETLAQSEIKSQKKRS